MPPKIPTRDDLVARENAIAHRMAGIDIENVQDAVTADRLTRWEVFVSQMDIPPELVEWSRQMHDLHGPKVKIFRNKIDWITALLIARYGEAEYHWPPEFSIDDIRRAWRWLAGDAPEGTAYITVEGN